MMDFMAKVEVEISTIWALSEFTEDVGPTRVVPVSLSAPRSYHIDLPAYSQGTSSRRSMLVPVLSIV